jgi:hypothetical protein
VIWQRGLQLGCNSRFVAVTAKANCLNLLTGMDGHAARGTGCAILSPLRSTNRRPPSRGAATMGKSSLPSFTMRERIWRGYGFCRFPEDYLRQKRS